MRIGPDGLPRPWAAESVAWVDDKTIDVKLRPGMKWHDGQPVTLDDVIFSFEAPAGDKAPMYKPFVTDIASIEKTGDQTARFTLKAAQRRLPHLDARQDQPDPEAHLGADPEGPGGKPENAEQLKERARSAPARSRWCAGSPPRRSCWSATAITSGAEDRPLDPAHRAQRRGHARHAEARRDQLPVGIFGGDPEVLTSSPRRTATSPSGARSTSASSSSP